MANRTVEFITNQYGRAVLQNAASESTLRELLESFRDLEDNIDGTGGSGIGGAAKSGKNIIGKVWRGAKRTYRIAENTTKAFVDNLENNRNTLSAWGSAVNENLVKQVPLVGEFVGGLADIFITSMQAIEGWNDKLQEISKTGATFNNSLVDLKVASVNAWMSLDAYSKMISDNAEKLTFLGGTVSTGVKVFDGFMSDLYKDGSGVRTELLHMGMTSDDINKTFMRYFTNTIRGTDINRINHERVTKEFVEYAKFTQIITSLTGKTGDQMADSVKQTTDDISFANTLAMADKRNRGKIISTLELSQALFGDSGRKLFQFSQQNMADLAGVGLQMSQFAPSTKALLDELMAISNDTSITQEQYNQKSIEILQKYLPEIPGDIEKIQSLIMQTAGNVEGSEILRESLKGLSDLVVSFGGAQGLTKEAIAQRIIQARREQQSREAFTRILNEINQALASTYADLFKELSPAFKEFGAAMKQLNLDKVVSGAGTDLQNAFTGGWEKIKEFVKIIGSPEGQTMMQRKAEALADLIKALIKGAAIRSFFGDNWFSRALQGLTDSDTTEINRLRNRISAQDRIAEDQVNRPTVLRIFGKDAAGNDIQINTTSAAVKEKIIELRNKGVMITDIFAQGEATRRTRSSGRGGALNWWDVAEGTPVRARISGILTIRDRNNTSLEITDEANGIRSVVTNMGPWSTGDMYDNSTITGGLDGKAVKAGDIIGYYKTFRGRTGMGPINERLETIPFFRRGSGTLIDVPGLNKGTLGQYGRLFGDFDPTVGTPALLHGKEAVVTPNQMANLMTNAGQISVAELVTSLNSNVRVLISMCEDELRLEKNKLKALESAA